MPEPAAADLLSADVIAKVAKLARLELSDHDVERFTRQLGDMLSHFADIDALVLDDVHPMSQPYALRNVLRDDTVDPGLDRVEVLAAAPATEDERFRVPPILGVEP